jgi:hypothetical protein
MPCARPRAAKRGPRARRPWWERRRCARRAPAPPRTRRSWQRVCDDLDAGHAACFATACRSLRTAKDLAGRRTGAVGHIDTTHGADPCGLRSHVPCTGEDRNRGHQEDIGMYGLPLLGSHRHCHSWRNNRAKTAILSLKRCRTVPNSFLVHEVFPMTAALARNSVVRGRSTGHLAAAGLAVMLVFTGFACTNAAIEGTGGAGGTGKGGGGSSGTSGGGGVVIVISQPGSTPRAAATASTTRAASRNATTAMWCRATAATALARSKRTGPARSRASAPGISFAETDRSARARSATTAIPWTTTAATPPARFRIPLTCASLAKPACAPPVWQQTHRSGRRLRGRQHQQRRRL